MVEQEPNAVKALNDLLSTLLPSLCEIEFYGPHSKKLYDCVLIEGLIKEQLQTPASFRAVRVKSYCWPELTDDYTTGATALPVYIECVEIDGPDETYLMLIAIMVADTLVELKLNPAVKEYLWRPFESESALDSTNPILLFPSL
ncbi:hypothetical protein GGI24_004830 [Coemansia furcata]|nr:hypothetical protein GGI24_004830 [Coemansia furcata]